MPCPISKDVSLAADQLRKGRLVAFATETVYGLGANAFDTNAVARIFEVKRRPNFDPLIVHIADPNWLDRLVVEIPRDARKLIKHFWPGPLTLVLPKTKAVPDLVTSGLPTIAVRIPDHLQALQLLREADIPIAAPSANLFGRISPTCAQHVAEQLGERSDLILDGGPCRVGVESTVLEFASSATTILRLGGVTVEQIESLIGSVFLAKTAGHPSAKGLSSPGMLSKHYAPRTPLKIESQFGLLPTGKRLGLLTLTPINYSEQFAVVEVLSASGNLNEAAANFFSALQRLDTRRLDLIIAIPFPNEGLGRTLNDRLQRAAD